MATKRKIIPPRETLEFEVGTITLMPARYEYFESITEIVNKYFSTFNNSINDYAEKRAAIIAKHEDESMRNDALIAFDRDTDVGYDIAQSILAVGKDAAEDAREFISACIDSTKDNSLELTHLTIVEVIIMLGVCIGLNLNFFNQNQEIMGLKALLKTAEEKPAKKNSTNGAKSLPA